MKNYEQPFHLRMKTARVLIRKMTIQELAVKTGIAPYRLAYIETKRHMPQIDEAAKIAEALEVPFNWLCGVKDAAPGSGLTRAEERARSIIGSGHRLSLRVSATGKRAKDQYSNKKKSE